MTQFIYFPLVALGIAALIVVGTFAPTGTNVTTVSPITNSGCGSVVGYFYSIQALISGIGCTFSQGVSGYLFPINIQQYTITVTSTICYFYPQLGNPCITQTYTGTNTNTLTTSTGTTCGFVGYLSCILSQQSSSSSNGNTPASIQLGFLAVIFVLLGVIIISGITVVSSGLNTASIYIIFKVMGYTLLWLALSGLAEPIFYGSQQSIPYPYGSLLYLGLSLSFLLGVIGVV